MKIGLMIYGSLDTLSGGYMYDRKMVESLRGLGHSVDIFSLSWRNYAAHLTDNLRFRLPPGLDLLIQDELNHPSLLGANAGVHPYPLVSLVHHLRCSELRPVWQNAFYATFERCYLRSVDHFIFNSKTTNQAVNVLLGGQTDGLVAYPPTDRFGAALSVQQVMARAQQPGPLRLVFLGNLISRKGLHTLLSALAQVEADIHLDVIGSPAVDAVYAAAMQRQALRAELAGRVDFLGALDNAALAEKLRAAQVLVVPSSYEGYGIVYLEGMAFGLPAIGAAAGGAAEIIREGETGYLVAAGDVGSLAEHLQELACNRQLLARLALNALQRYQQQPGWMQTAQSIEMYLKAILQNWQAA